MEQRTPTERTALFFAALLLFLYEAVCLLTPCLAFLPSGWGHASAYLLPLALFLALPTYRQKIALLPHRAHRFAALPFLPLLLVTVPAVAQVTAWAVGLPAGEALAVTPENILLHAARPALLEEMLFRFALLALLSAVLPRSAVWIDALLFALLHAELYQLPYAFCGGILLALTALCGGGLGMAFLFHFLNNLFSLILVYLYGQGMYAAIAFIFILFGLLAVGAVSYLIRHRKNGVYRPLTDLLSPGKHTLQDLRAVCLSPLGAWCLFSLVTMLLRLV